jgi:hypothetical protein
LNRRQVPGFAWISQIDAQSVARRQIAGVADVQQFER